MLLSLSFPTRCPFLTSIFQPPLKRHHFCDKLMLQCHDAFPVLSVCADIPFEKAVAGVRVGWINGKPVVNPTVSAFSCAVPCVYEL